MDAETAEVTEIKGDRAVVQMEVGGQCRHCGARFACSAMGGSLRQVTVHNSIQVEIGDRVEIGYQSKIRMLFASAIFVFPILMAIIGYFLGKPHYGTEGSGIIGSIAGLIVAFTMLWVLNRVVERKHQVLPTLLKKI